MAKTTLVNIANTATAITTTIATTSVTVGEDASPPTTDFKVRAPTSTDAAIRRIKGPATGNVTFTFTCPGLYWPAGTIVGYLEVVTGVSVSFGQFEPGV